MRIAAIVLGVLCLLGGGLILWLRPMVEGPPVFTIEHELEFAGSPSEVWDVFMDAARYADWNPYLLELTGELRDGGEIEILIIQQNWDEPMRLTETVVDIDPPVSLHWRGSLAPAGFFQTDHSFRIESIGADRVRFTQREEFRGKLAEYFDDEWKGHTQRAFRAMDEALARRVEERRGSEAD